MSSLPQEKILHFRMNYVSLIKSNFVSFIFILHSSVSFKGENVLRPLSGWKQGSNLFLTGAYIHLYWQPTNSYALLD